VVCLSVCHTSEPCKNGCTDRDAVWVKDSGGPKEPCIRWGSRSSSRERAILREKERYIVKHRDTAVSCAKTAEPTEMPYGLRAWVGPRKHVWRCRLALSGEYHWLNRPCAAPMQPVVKLLCQLVIIIMSLSCIVYSFSRCTGTLVENRKFPYPTHVL